MPLYDVAFVRVAKHSTKLFSSLQQTTKCNLFKFWQTQTPESDCDHVTHE